MLMRMMMISISAIMISTVNNDEDLGIHVVGQRLGLGTPSTQPSSPSPSPLDLTNIFFIIVIPDTWPFHHQSINQFDPGFSHNYHSHVLCSPHLDYRWHHYLWLHQHQHHQHHNLLRSMGSTVSTLKKCCLAVPALVKGILGKEKAGKIEFERQMFVQSSTRPGQVNPGKNWIWETKKEEKEGGRSRS